MGQWNKQADRSDLAVRKIAIEMYRRNDARTPVGSLFNARRDFTKITRYTPEFLLAKYPIIVDCSIHASFIDVLELKRFIAGALAYATAA